MILFEAVKGPGKWVEKAACAGIDTEVLFPAPRDHVGREEALDVCRACPVMVECRAYFDQVEPPTASVFGVVGGETPVMRIARRKRESGVEEQ